MRLSNLLSCLALLAPWVHSEAQATPPVEHPPVPPVVLAAVRAAAADAWQLEPAAIVVTWGATSVRAYPPTPRHARVVSLSPSGAATVAVTDEAPPGRGGTRAPAPHHLVAVRVGVQQTVLVAARLLPRDHPLGPGDLAREQRPRWGAPVSGGAITVTNGWITRRVIQPGEVLHPPAVAPPPVILRGDSVVVTAVQPGLRLRAIGIALAPAHLGDRVPIQLSATRRLMALATGPRAAEVR